MMMMVTGWVVMMMMESPAIYYYYKTLIKVSYLRTGHASFLLHSVLRSGNEEANVCDEMKLTQWWCKSTLAPCVN